MMISFLQLLALVMIACSISSVSAKEVQLEAPSYKQEPTVFSCRYQTNARQGLKRGHSCRGPAGIFVDVVSVPEGNAAVKIVTKEKE